MNSRTTSSPILWHLMLGFALFMLLRGCEPCPAATVQFYMTNSVGTADTNLIRVFPVSTPINADGSYLITGLPIRVQPNTNGFAQTNLLKGNYLATNQFLVSGVFSSVGTPQGVLFAVDDSTNTYTFNSTGHLISGGNTFNYTPGVNAFISTNGIEVTNLGGGVYHLWLTSEATNGVPVAAGTNVALVTNAGVVTIHGLVSHIAVQASMQAATNYALSIGLNITNHSTFISNQLYALIYDIGENATNYVNAVTNVLATTNYVAAHGTIVSNGLVTHVTAVTNTIQAKLDQKAATNIANSITTGLLSSNNWSTFNAKAETSITNTFATTNYAQALTNGFVTSAITNTLATTNYVNEATNALQARLDQKAGTNTANAVTTGLLTSNNWSTFNGKAETSITNTFATTNYVNTATSSLAAVTLLTAATNALDVALKVLIATKQASSMVLSNLVGTGAFTNAINPGTNVAFVTNAGIITIHGTVLPVGVSVAAGSRVTAATNGSEITISANSQTNGFTSIVASNAAIFYPTVNPSNYLAAPLVTNIANAAALAATQTLSAAAVVGAVAQATHATNADIATTANNVSSAITNAFYPRSNPSNWVMVAAGTLITATTNANTVTISAVNQTNGYGTAAYSNAVAFLTPVQGTNVASNQVFTATNGFGTAVYSNATAWTTPILSTQIAAGQALAATNVFGSAARSNATSFLRTNAPLAIGSLTVSNDSLTGTRFHVGDYGGKMAAWLGSNAFAIHGASGVGFVGDGQDVTNMNATELRSGTMSIAQFPPDAITNTMSGRSLPHATLSNATFMSSGTAPRMAVSNENLTNLVFNIWPMTNGNVMWNLGNTNGDTSYGQLLFNTVHDGGATNPANSEVQLALPGSVAIGMGFGNTDAKGHMQWGIGPGNYWMYRQYGRINLNASNAVNFGMPDTWKVLIISNSIQRTYFPGFVAEGVSTNGEYNFHRMRNMGQDITDDWSTNTISFAGNDYVRLNKQGYRHRGGLMFEKTNVVIVTNSFALDFGSAQTVELRCMETQTVTFYATNWFGGDDNRESRVFIIRSGGLTNLFSWPSTFCVLGYTNGGTIPTRLEPGQLLRLQVDSIGEGYSNILVEAKLATDNGWAWDADFLAYAARIGDGGLTVQQSNAVNWLTINAKRHGWFADCDAILPFTGGSSNAHAQNLKQASYAVTWTASGVTHSSDGVTGDGTSGYGDTGFTPSSAGGLFATNSAHLFIYSGTTSPSDNKEALGVANSSFTANAGIRTRTASVAWQAIGLNNAVTDSEVNTSSDWRGPVVALRTGSTNNVVYTRDRTGTTTTNITVALPNRKIYVLARNAGNDGTGDRWFNGNLRAATWGRALSTSYPIFRKDWDDFQESLGRKVP